VYKDNNNGLKKILHKMFDSSEVSKLFTACIAKYCLILFLKQDFCKGKSEIVLGDLKIKRMCSTRTIVVIAK
jgi:hypothetical protein